MLFPAALHAAPHKTLERGISSDDRARGEVRAVPPPLVEEVSMAACIADMSKLVVRNKRREGLGRWHPRRSTPLGMSMR